MQNYLSIAQAAVAILLVISILLQQRGSGMGSAFGGGDGGAYSTRRGLQKNFFWATVILGTLFVVLSLLNLFLSK